MFEPSTTTHSVDEPAFKRLRIDDQDTATLAETAPPIDSEDAYAHRKMLRGRATLTNAADNVHFSKRRALVFNFIDVFDILVDDLGRLKTCRLRCGICRTGKGWSWESGGKAKGSTSNMLVHMKSKHLTIWNDALLADRIAWRQVIETSGESAAVKTEHSVPLVQEPAFNIDEYYRRLTRWIATGSQPFTEVENQEFQELLTYLKPALEGHLLQSQAIRDRVFSHAGALRRSTKKYLASLPGLMAIACDAWTSSNRIAFLAITGSWVTHDWRLEETLLDFVELQGVHDGQNMATAVASALTDLGIEEKLVALVSNNASNNGTLVRHLSTILERSLPASSWDRDKGHIRCLAHVIHLAVMCLLRGMKAVPPSTNIRDFDPGDQFLTVDEAECFVADDNRESNESDYSTAIDLAVNLASAVSKIRKITKIVRSSPQRMELFRATAERIEEYNEQRATSNNQKYKRKVIKNLVLDVVTRWNSVFFMLERALEFSEAIDALTSHPKVSIYCPYALSKSDWASVKQICTSLKFFRSASEMMSGEKYPTLSFSLSVYFVLISYVLGLEKSVSTTASPAFSAGICACKDKLLEFFDKSTYDSEYYYFATILDPRFKDTLFKSNHSIALELFSKEWIDDCATSLQDTCNEFYDAEHLNNAEHIEPPQLHEVESSNDFLRAWKAQLPSRSSRANSSSSLAIEISRYLGEEITSMEPLSWWRLNAHRFPRLAAMARDFLCIPGTSVAVERVFSSGRDVISVRRASLSAETIRMLMTYRAGIMLEKAIPGGFTSYR